MFPEFSWIHNNFMASFKRQFWGLINRHGKDLVSSLFVKLFQMIQRRIISQTKWNMCFWWESEYSKILHFRVNVQLKVSIWEYFIGFDILGTGIENEKCLKNGSNEKKNCWITCLFVPYCIAYTKARTVIDRVKTVFIISNIPHVAPMG